MGARAEGFLGTVMAVEGISDASTLLHGPDGCRMVMNDATTRYYPRPTERVERAVPFYKGSARIPCTGVDPNDYIYGATEKVTEALKVVGARSEGLIAVVNSPGASLIGDDCRLAAHNSGYEDRTIVLDAKLMSIPLNVGIDRATVEILRKLIPGKAEKVKGRINVLGVNILTKDWQLVVEEFGRIFSLMGLEVACFLSAGCTVQQIRDSATAECNVVLCPDYVGETVEYYGNELGIPSVRLPYSAVGFGITEELVRMTAEATGTDPEPAVAYIDEYRKRAFGLMDNMRLRLRGKTFDLEAEPSMVLSLLRLLYEDLNLVPQRIAFNGCTNDEAEKLVEAYLEGIGLTEVMHKENSVFPDYMLADGNKAWIYETTGRCSRAIDLGYPSENCHCFRNSAVLGPSGMLYLLDRIVMPKGY